MSVEQDGKIVADHQDNRQVKIVKTLNGGNEKCCDSPEVSDTRLFKRRWLQLVLFIMCSIMNNMQWFQYTVCSNIMQRYWGVSSLAIEWTCMIYMVVYLLTIIPATHLMGRVGLRWSILIAAGGTTLGAWVKVLSVSPDLFAVTFIGHTIVAVAQMFIISNSGRLAACWFGSKEVASATTAACYGIQIGISIGTMVTPITVKNHEDIADIGADLYKYFIAYAMTCTIGLFLVLLLFQDEPPLPPSMTRSLQKANRETKIVEGFWPPVKRILTNRSFVMLWNSYGCVAGVLGAIATVSNPLYLAHFKNGEVEVGQMGLVASISGTLGATFFAFLLDRTKKFRTISTSLYVLTLIFQIVSAFSMIMEVKWLVFVISGVWGVFIVGYAATSLELCAETTYPEDEGVAMGILYIANQVYGITAILITGRMIEYYGDKAGHACITAILTLGTILTIFNKLDLRRSRAIKAAGYGNVTPMVLKSEKNDMDKP